MIWTHDEYYSKLQGLGSDRWEGHALSRFTSVEYAGRLKTSFLDSCCMLILEVAAMGDAQLRASKEPTAWSRADWKS